MRFKYNDGYATLEIESEYYSDKEVLLAFGSGASGESRARLDVVAVKVLVAELQRWIIKHDKPVGDLVKISGGGSYEP